MALLSDAPSLAHESLEAFWMPFTANRQFKSHPRMLVKAEGMYYTTDDGRRILDGFAGLWCCNAGHCRKPIVEAIQKQAAVMDYAPAFQMGRRLLRSSPVLVATRLFAPVASFFRLITVLFGVGLILLFLASQKEVYPESATPDPLRSWPFQ